MYHFLKKLIKKLPVEISITSLALILALAERGGIFLETILEGRRSGLLHKIKKIERAKNFWDYYAILKNIKINSAKTILWRLKQKGLVKRDGKNYHLTNVGKTIAKIFKKEIHSEIQWDKKYRMILFDIPEKYRHHRKWLRTELIGAGYQPLQKSVFIGKFSIEENFMKAIIDRGLYKYVRILTISEIDDEAFLMQL